MIFKIWWGGGWVIFAKYGGVGVRFAIYPSEKHLPKIGNMIHLQFTLMIWLIAFMTKFKSSHILQKIILWVNIVPRGSSG